MKRDMKSIFRRLRGDQSGIVVILVALSMVSIVGFTGLAVDVGNVYYAEAKLQASTDSAALAGAQNINVGAGGTAISTATSYSAVIGQKNASTKLPATMVSGYPVLKCLTTTGISCTGPDSANAIEVKQQATVPLYFGEVLGLKAWLISATALAGARGGTTNPVDVMLVIDTTASMNNPDPSCSIPGATAEDCAMAGVRTLLSYSPATATTPASGLAPCSPSLANCGAAVSGNVANPVDRVGLMVFPGVTNAAQIPKDYDCSSSAPAIAAYNASPIYQIVPLSSDYRTSYTASSEHQLRPGVSGPRGKGWLHGRYFRRGRRGNLLRRCDLRGPGRSGHQRAADRAESDHLAQRRRRKHRHQRPLRHLGRGKTKRVPRGDHGGQGRRGGGDVGVLGLL